MISIVDYGVGNLGSIRNMLDYLDIAHDSVSTPAELVSAPALLLPGVGAFDSVLAAFDARGLREPLVQRVKAGDAKVLGICAGMQMLCEGSDEGGAAGLGLIPGRCAKFASSGSAGERLRVPHMGWAHLTLTQPHPLLRGLDDAARYYFVHSYYMDCPAGNVLATARHGADFAAVVGADNVVGCQFHPEKSHKFGMQILLNFSAWASS